MKFARILCFLLGHDYFVIQEFRPIYPGASASRRLGCMRCPCEWGMHDESRALVPWSDEFEKMYETTGRRVLNR